MFKQNLALSIFVETGTFCGDSLEIVSGDFEQIYSVEFSEEYFKKAKARFSDRTHIHLYQNDSPSFLKKLNFSQTHKKEGVLYWLDAHWCAADATAGLYSQCPLLKELEAIGELNQESVIL